MVLEDEALVSAIIDDEAQLKRLFQKLSKQSSEVELIAKDEGLHIITFPPHQVAISHIFLSREDLELYEFNLECQICVDMDMLAKVISRTKRGDGIALEFTQNNLRIIIVRDETKTFNFKLMEISNWELNFQKVQNNVLSLNPIQIVVPTTIIEPIQDIISLSEDIIIAGIDSTIKVEGENITSKMGVHPIEKKVYGKYSTYLIHEQLPVNAIRTSTFKLYLNENIPLILELKFGHGSYYESIISNRVMENEEVDGILNVPSLDDDDFIDIEI